MKKYTINLIERSNVVSLCSEIDIEWIDDGGCPTFRFISRDKKTVEVTYPEGCADPISFKVTCTSGCDDCQPEYIVLTPCMSDADCPDCELCGPSGFCETVCKEGEFCINNTCLECDNNNPCPNNQICSGGQCVCPPGLYKDSKGNCVECDPNNPCDGCKSCVNGTCVELDCLFGQVKDPSTCNCVTCFNDSHCGTNETCVDNECECLPTHHRVNGVCVERPTCNYDSDCEECKTCNNGHCVPKQCPVGYVCYKDECLKKCGNCPPGSNCVYVFEVDEYICVSCNGDCNSQEDCGPGCMCFKGQCVENPCFNYCSNGKDCGMDCGCLHGECVPCYVLSPEECALTDGCKDINGDCFKEEVVETCEEAGCPEGFECVNNRCEMKVVEHESLYEGSLSRATYGWDPTAYKTLFFVAQQAKENPDGTISPGPVFPKAQRSKYILNTTVQNISTSGDYINLILKTKILISNQITELKFGGPISIKDYGISIDNKNSMIFKHSVKTKTSYGEEVYTGYKGYTIINDYIQHNQFRVHKLGKFDVKDYISYGIQLEVDKDIVLYNETIINKGNKALSIEINKKDYNELLRGNTLEYTNEVVETSGEEYISYYVEKKSLPNGPVEDYKIVISKDNEYEEKIGGNYAKLSPELGLEHGKYYDIIAVSGNHPRYLTNNSCENKVGSYPREYENKFYDVIEDETLIDKGGLIFNKIFDIVGNEIVFKRDIKIPSGTTMINDTIHKIYYSYRDGSEISIKEILDRSGTKSGVVYSQGEKLPIIDELIDIRLFFGTEKYGVICPQPTPFFGLRIPFPQDTYMFHPQIRKSCDGVTNIEVDLNIENGVAPYTINVYEDPDGANNQIVNNLVQSSQVLSFTNSPYTTDTSFKIVVEDKEGNTTEATIEYTPYDKDDMVSVETQCVGEDKYILFIFNDYKNNPYKRVLVSMDSYDVEDLEDLGNGVRRLKVSSGTYECVAMDWDSTHSEHRTCYITKTVTTDCCGNSLDNKYYPKKVATDLHIVVQNNNSGKVQYTVTRHDDENPSNPGTIEETKVVSGLNAYTFEGLNLAKMYTIKAKSMEGVSCHEVINYTYSPAILCYEITNNILVTNYCDGTDKYVKVINTKGYPLDIDIDASNEVSGGTNSNYTFKVTSENTNVEVKHSTFTNCVVNRIISGFCCDNITPISVTGRECYGSGGDDMLKITFNHITRAEDQNGVNLPINNNKVTVNTTLVTLIIAEYQDSNGCKSTIIINDIECDDQGECFGNDGWHKMDNPSSFYNDTSNIINSASTVLEAVMLMTFLKKDNSTTGGNVQAEDEQEFLTGTNGLNNLLENQFGVGNYLADGVNVYIKEPEGVKNLILEGSSETPPKIYTFSCGSPL